MKTRITVEQALQLDEKQHEKLLTWFDSFHEWGDDFVSVYIVEEKDGEYAGIYTGLWDAEYKFVYPEKYIGSLNQHEGTVYPLLSIEEMLVWIEQTIGWVEYDSYGKQYPLWNIKIDGTLCDRLWEYLRLLL